MIEEKVKCVFLLFVMEKAKVAVFLEFLSDYKRRTYFIIKHSQYLVIIRINHDRFCLDSESKEIHLSTD